LSHVLRPASEKTFSLADALAGIPRCILLVESAVLAFVDDPGSEPLRTRARELVRALASGCPDCGFQEPPSILRRLTFLLAVPPSGSPALLRSMADRLIEQVGLLKAIAQERQR